MTDMLTRGEKLPVDFKDRFIYYVGPVEAVRDEAVGPAGPTTAPRMDKFTRQMLAETGPHRHDRQSRACPAGIDAIREFEAVYLIAIAGAAYSSRRPSKAAKSSPSPTLAWKPSTSSSSRTCPSPSPSTAKALASTKPARKNGRVVLRAFPSSNDAAVAPELRV